MSGVLLAVAATAALTIAVMWPLHHFVLGPRYAREQAAIKRFRVQADQYFGNLPAFVDQFNAFSAAYEAPPEDQS